MGAKGRRPSLFRQHPPRHSQAGRCRAADGPALSCAVHRNHRQHAGWRRNTHRKPKLANLCAAVSQQVRPLRQRGPADKVLRPVHGRFLPHPRGQGRSQGGLGPHRGTPHGQRPPAQRQNQHLPAAERSGLPGLSQLPYRHRKGHQEGPPFQQGENEAKAPQVLCHVCGRGHQ